jgi:hypothetical protein
VIQSFDFFISYRRAAAGAIIRDIKSTLIDPYDYKVFLDLDDLKHSNDWKKSVDENLAKSRVILVVLARGSFLPEHTNTDSDEFLYEIGRAKDLDKPLITIDYDGFFSANETQRIINKDIAKWLNQPTAIPFKTSDHECRKNLIAGIIEKMKGYDTTLDSFGGYLPETYIEEQIHILRLKAKRFFDNDSRIDHSESYQLFNFAKEKHIDHSIVSKVIDEFDKTPTTTLQSKPSDVQISANSKFDERNIEDRQEEPSNSVTDQPLPLNNPSNALELSKNQEVPFEEALDFESGESEEYDAYEYFRLGSLKVTEVLNSADRDDLIAYICFYAFSDEDVSKSVLDKLNSANPTSKISNAIEEYVQFLDIDIVGDISVAVARDWSMERVIAKLLNEPDIAMIQNILAETHGRTKVWKAFAEFWPDSTTDDIDCDESFPASDYHSIGSMKVSEVLSHEWLSYLIDLIAEFSKKSTQTVKKYLNSADNNQLVIDAVKGYRDFAYLSNLAGYNVKYAKDYELSRVISEALRVSDLAIVESILSATNGHTLLRKAFSEYWPK